MTERLTADDFLTGVFSALSLKEWRTISLKQDRFDNALAHVFETLKAVASERGVELRFRIKLHRIHGDSQTIRDAITSAVQRDLISLDNPEFQNVRLKIVKNEAEDYLDSVPGGQELFMQLADEFVSQYESADAELIS